MKTTKRLPGIEAGSGNVYRDLGFRNPDAMKIKSTLVTGIRAIMEERQLSQVEAAQIMGIPQPRLSRLLRGQFERISQEKLIESLNRLGQNVRITLGPAPKGEPGRSWIENSKRVVQQATIPA